MHLILYQISSIYIPNKALTSQANRRSRDVFSQERDEEGHSRLRKQCEHMYESERCGEYSRNGG